MPITLMIDIKPAIETPRVQNTRVFSSGDGLGVLIHLLLWSLSFFGLQAGVASFCESCLESLKSSFAVNVLDLTGIKWVACIANIDAKLFYSASSDKFVTTTACYFGFVVVRVNSLFHDLSSFSQKIEKTQQ